MRRRAARSPPAPRRGARVERPAIPPSHAIASQAGILGVTPGAGATLIIRLPEVG